MPLYEYRCHRCGKTFEVLQKFSDDPLTQHEECGGELERLLSPPTLQFKGTGWYVTDYARRGTNGSGKRSETAPAGGSSSGGEAKAESKPEAKPVTKE